MSKSILKMPTFRDNPCGPLHQDEEQPNTELFLQAVPFYTLLVGVVGRKKRIVGGVERGGENWLIFNNRENGFSYFIY